MRFRIRFPTIIHYVDGKSNLDSLDKDQLSMRRVGTGDRPCDVIRRRQTNQYDKSSIWFIDLFYSTYNYVKQLSFKN